MIHLRSAVRLLAVAGLLAFTGLIPESASATDICSCTFCAAHPSVDCQIGPGDGFSILCADYSKLHCAAAAATCQAAPPFLAESATSAPAVATPARFDPAGLANKFHGFCPCGCSFVPDCNTSADCFGGATCQTAPSCC
ncbi:MAG TPA: hypothetical protein VFI63_00010 [Solirubrobacterales bacterium]|nr:hypothetical protein [Solirubrobacterales bacterium]